MDIFYVGFKSIYTDLEGVWALGIGHLKAAPPLQQVINIAPHHPIIDFPVVNGSGEYLLQSIGEQPQFLPSISRSADNLHATHKLLTVERWLLWRNFDLSINC